MLNFVLSCSVSFLVKPSHTPRKAPSASSQKVALQVPFLCQWSDLSDVPPPLPINSLCCAPLWGWHLVPSLFHTATPSSCLYSVCPIPCMNVANACSLLLSSKFPCKAVIFASSVMNWQWLEKNVQLNHSCKKLDWSYNHCEVSYLTWLGCR